MATNAAAPVTIKTTQTRTTLNMDDVLLQKSAPFTPVANAQEALSQLGNDSDAFLRIINEGLRIELRKKLESDVNSPWYEVDETTGKVSSDPYTEPTIDSATVSNTIMTFAMIAGYNASLTKDQKKALKAAAREKVKANAAVIFADYDATEALEEN